jgi:hypothetical protein
MTKTDATMPERGLKNPRDGAVSWQLYDRFGACRGKRKPAELSATRATTATGASSGARTVWLKEPEVMSWKPQVQVKGEGDRWHDNQLRFATKEEARPEPKTSTAGGR